MKSRFLLNIFMLLLFTGLLSVVIFFSPNKDSQQTLTQLSPENINSIFIPRKKGNIELRKINNQWQMISPYKMPAHDFRIQHLLKLSQLTSKKFYLADQLELSNYQLQPARARIRFNQTWIDFGTSNPVNDMRYIKSGDTVLLAHDDTYALINSTPSSFVNLSLLPKNSAIQSLFLPQQQLRLINNLWQVTPPQAISADEIQNFLQRWKSAQAFGVHAYLPRKQLGNIEVQLQDQRIVFEISDKSPWLILARPDIGIEYHLASEMTDKLLRINSQPIDSNSTPINPDA